MATKLHTLYSEWVKSGRPAWEEKSGTTDRDADAKR